MTNVVELLLDSSVEELRVLSKPVEDDDRVLCVELGLLLELLDPCDYFSCVPFDFEIVVLFDVQDDSA